MLDLKKLLTKILQELKYSKLNTDNFDSSESSKGNTVSFSVDNNTGEVSVTSQSIKITPSQIKGDIPANNITGLPAAGTNSPQPVGTSATAGTATTWSKSDHVHNISKNTIISALEYTPYDSNNPDGYGKITGISSTAPINGSGTTGTINLSHSTSGVTAGTYGSTSTATETPAFGANIIVPGFNVNNTGHITTASTHNITIPSNTFTAATSAATGQKGLVPATSTLTVATYLNDTNKSRYWLNANGSWELFPSYLKVGYNNNTGESSISAGVLYNLAHINNAISVQSNERRYFRIESQCAVQSPARDRLLALAIQPYEGTEGQSGYNELDAYFAYSRSIADTTTQGYELLSCRYLFYVDEAKDINVKLMFSGSGSSTEKYKIIYKSILLTVQELPYISRND